MKKLIFAAAILASTSAFAQQPKEYTLTLNANEVNVIGTALGQRPFIEVKDLLVKLESQIQVQNLPKPEAPKADEAPKQ